MNARFALPRPLWLALPLLVLVATAAVQVRIALNHDVAWMLLAAQRMLRGGSYLADFFEVNMPLGIAIYAPVEGLRLLGLSVPDATRGWLLLLAVLSVALGAALLRPGRRPLLASWLLLGLVLLPTYDFAQREHFAVVLLLPFLCLLAGGRAAPVPVRAGVAVLAALGAFLKPHYAPLPFVLLALHGGPGVIRGAWRSLESGVLLGCGVAYAAVVASCYPEWFEVAAWARDLYGAYQAKAWDEVLTVEIVVGAMMLAVLAALAREDRALGRTLTPFLLAAAYGLLVYFLQFKGWRYQALPFGLFTFAALGLGLRALADAPEGELVTRRRARLTLAALVAVAGIHAVSAALAAPRTKAFLNSGFVQGLSGLPRGAPVAALSTAMLPFFPAVTLLELNWSLRYPSLWPLAGLASAPREGASAADDERYRSALVAGLVEDLQRHRPVAVIVDERPAQFGLPDGFLILDYLRADPRFAAVWSHYAKGMEGGGFVIYFLDETPNPAQAASSSTGSTASIRSSGAQSVWRRVAWNRSAASG